MAAERTIDALNQFELYPVLGQVGAVLQISQSPVFMAIAVLIVLALLYAGMRPAAVVPGRLQAAAEIAMSSSIILLLRRSGRKGRHSSPRLRDFLLHSGGNYLGLLPYSFTFTSHIVITLALALMVFAVSILASLRYQGLGFFTHFMPEGAPKLLAPLLIPIEIISFLSRPSAFPSGFLRI